MMIYLTLPFVGTTLSKDSAKYSSKLIGYYAKQFKTETILYHATAGTTAKYMHYRINRHNLLLGYIMIQPKMLTS